MLKCLDEAMVHICLRFLSKVTFYVESHLVKVPRRHPVHLRSHVARLKRDQQWVS